MHRGTCGSYVVLPESWGNRSVKVEEASDDEEKKKTGGERRRSAGCVTPWLQRTVVVFQISRAESQLVHVVTCTSASRPTRWAARSLHRDLTPDRQPADPAVFALCYKVGRVVVLTDRTSSTGRRRARYCQPKHAADAWEWSRRTSVRRSGPTRLTDWLPLTTGQAGPRTRRSATLQRAVSDAHGVGPNS